jgi:hypothetical protein
LNPRHKQFRHYGGRGIKISERWDDFETFLSDMGLRPTPKHSIDRYPNNDGNYAPDNCRWATKKEQALNRRDNRIVEAFGKTAPLGAFVPQGGGSVEYNRILRRINSGMQAEAAIRAILGD